MGCEELQAWAFARVVDRVLQRREFASGVEGKPVLPGFFGGTERHSLAIDYAMRPLFAYLRTSVVPTSVYAASEDWGSTETGLPDRITRAGAELAALMTARPAPPKPDPYENPVPFEDLLSAGSR
ncbi:NAD(P)H-dependent oxidoreductase [Actinomadura sp. BRA 177]|uniref:NAD(P)H-dependent oxidoreductase n=1 Tax=Actinomadura sp. BRA 177 TaxID=2745202 RepID=UPI0015959421|nr:NAD(P)H-dependent oxidoreductase [Actinomadura sp. BRA 177]NVI90279.1 NAD(P)H-dependent oxidoreductase [Actinomadura sp. BRA 177]